MQSFHLIILFLFTFCKIGFSQKTDEQTTSVFLVSIPSDENEFRNIFHRNPQDGEMENINKHIEEFKKIENIHFIKTLNDIELVINKFNSSQIVVFTLIGHNENGNFHLANNEFIHLKEFVKKAGTRTSVILSCNAKSFVDPSVLAINDELTFREAIELSKIIRKEAPGCAGLLTSPQQATKNLADVLNKKKSNNLKLQFLVASGALSGTVILLKYLDESDENEKNNSKDSTKNKNNSFRPMNSKEKSIHYARSDQYGGKVSVGDEMIKDFSILKYFTNFLGEKQPQVVSGTASFTENVTTHFDQFYLYNIIDSLEDLSLSFSMNIRSNFEYQDGIDSFFKQKGKNENNNLADFRLTFPDFFSELLKINFNISFYQTDDFESSLASWYSKVLVYGLDTINASTFLDGRNISLIYNSSEKVIQLKGENILPLYTLGEDVDFSICNANKCLIVLNHWQNKVNLPFDLSLSKLSLNSSKKTTNPESIAFQIAVDDLIENRCVSIKRWLFNNIQCSNSN